MTKNQLDEDYPLDGDVEPSPVVKTKRMIGLQHGEHSIIAALPQEFIAEFGHVIDTTEVSYEEEDTLPDLVNNESNLERLLTDRNFKLLQQILEELKEFDSNKWETWQLDDLFPDLLRNPQNIVKQCIIKEIEIIAKIMHSYTGRTFFSSAFNKAKNANLIGRAFEGTDFVGEMSVKQKNN